MNINSLINICFRRHSSISGILQLFPTGIAVSDCLRFYPLPKIYALTLAEQAREFSPVSTLYSSWRGKRSSSAAIQLLTDHRTNTLGLRRMYKARERARVWIT